MVDNFRGQIIECLLKINRKAEYRINKAFKMTLTILLIIVLAFIPYTHIKNEAADVTGSNETLSEQLNQLLNNDPNLKGALAGVSVRSGETGEIIYEHMGDVRLRPASNMKLLTAAAALSVLGSGYSFGTEILTDGNVKWKILNGNLYLKGKGDPTLLKADFDKMAKAIKEKGIKIIKGNLIGDDTWYDDIRYSIDLPWSDESTYYGAQVSALTASPDKDYDAGTVIIEVYPGNETGKKAKVIMKPNTSYLKIINNTKTVSSIGKKEITIHRKHGTNTIEVNGILPINSSEIKEWIAVNDPTRYALELFRQSLKEKGIKLLGDTKVATSPKNASILITHKSMPISSLLIPFMKLSNNGHAEILVKEMGKVVMDDGSWEKGLKVVNMELPVFGVNPATIVIRDGSGISHVDLIPANEISKLLFSIQAQAWFPDFVASLPVSGMSGKMVGGTLRNRMKLSSLQGRIKAKTGSISTISTLSGYLNTAGGNTLIFSILLNNLVDDTKGHAIEDKICAILASL